MPSGTTRNTLNRSSTASARLEWSFPKIRDKPPPPTQLLGDEPFGRKRHGPLQVAALPESRHGGRNPRGTLQNRSEGVSTLNRIPRFDHREAVRIRETSTS